MHNLKKTKEYQLFQQRRDEVKFLMNNGQVTAQQKKSIAEKFSCSVSSIEADIKFHNKSVEFSA